MSSSSSVSNSSSMRRVSMYLYPHGRELEENDDMLNQDISYSFRSRSSSVRYYKCLDSTVTRQGSLSRPVRQSSVPAKTRTFSKWKNGYWITTDTDFVVLELSGMDFQNDLLFESEQISSGGNPVPEKITKLGS